ncbi:MAG TPA: glutathione S-transferase family protein [Burkholderiaceae bacterium]|nr:glutathione S-transferase family protein [Burkholderiaceae bacterium]
MIQLHYYPSNASMAPHILLEELGVPFELALVDRTRDAHKSPEYLKLNPNGLIPVLVHDELVLYETAAICLHLADTNGKASLAPAFGTPQRAHFYKWLMWLTNTLQPALLLYFYPERWVTPGHDQAAVGVKAMAEARIGAMLDQLNGEIASQGGPWLMGVQYTALDPFLLMLCRWTRDFSRPARNLPVLGAYLRRVLERPAVQRAFATEKLAKPWV